MKYLFIGLITVYRYTLAAMLGGQCRFHPSCSQYALDCFHGLPWYKAFALTLWRILRCQPFAEGGYDPAPIEPARPNE